MATSQIKSCISLMPFWTIQLFSSGVLAAMTSPPGCSVHQIGPGRPSPSVSFSNSLVISNLLLQQGDIMILQVHLYDDNGIHRADVFVNNFDKLVITKNEKQSFQTLASSRHVLPPAPRALYWQHLVINHTILNTIQAYNLDEEENTLIEGYVNKTNKVVINSAKNITVALHCINVPSVLINDPAKEKSQKDILQWRESIAWLLLLLSVLCIIFLSVALCMRRRALTSIHSIVPSFAKFLKTTSSHHTREPSAEMKVDVNMQIKREPEEVSDPSEISTIGNYIEELQPPSYTTQVTEVNSVPCEISSIESMDHYHQNKSSTSISNPTNISQVSESSLHRSHVTEQSYLPFDSSYESQNMQSKTSQAMSNETQSNLSNGFNNLRI